MRSCIFLCVLVVVIGAPKKVDAHLETFNSANDITKNDVEEAKGEAGCSQLVEAAETLKKCIVNSIDPVRLRKDIKEAAPKTVLDTVLRIVFCRNRTDTFECMGDYAQSVATCVPANDAVFNIFFNSIAWKLFDFICYNDGDIISQFIAANSPKCIKENENQLHHCFHMVSHKYFRGEDSADTTPSPDQHAESCNDLKTFQVCYVKQLEKCDDSTTARLFESMFNFIRNKLACNL